MAMAMVAMVLVVFVVAMAMAVRVMAVVVARMATVELVAPVFDVMVAMMGVVFVALGMCLGCAGSTKRQDGRKSCDQGTAENPTEDACHGGCSFG